MKINLLIPEKKRHIKLFYIFLGFLTLVIGFGMLNIQGDNNLTVLLPDNPDTIGEREKIARLSEEFPSSDNLLFVAIESHDEGGTPFTEDKIERLWQMTREIDELDTVLSTLNPFNTIYFRKAGRIFFPVKLNPDRYPKSQAQIDTFVENIASSRYSIGTILSYDKKTAGIVVRMNPDAMMGKEIENKNVFIRAFEKIFGRTLGPKKIDRSYFCNDVESVISRYDKDFKIYYAGLPVYEAKSKSYMARDIVILLIPVIIIMIMTFFLNFRSVRGTFLPIISMLLSMVWTMGIIGWIRYKLNVIGILIPPIIMTIGSSYTLHYLNSYYLHSDLENDSRSLVVRSTRLIFPTISTAAFTTIVGFASFLLARIDSVKKFGFFIIISIAFTLFFTFFLLSKILSGLKIPTQVRIDNVKNDVISSFIKLLYKVVFPLRFLWLGIFVGAITLFIIFVPGIKVETNPGTLFKEGDRVKQSLNFIQQNFKGTVHFNVTVRGEEGFFRTVEGMRAAEKVQDYIDKNVIIDGHTMLGWTLSPVTMLQDINNIMGNDYSIPDDSKTVSRFYSFLRSTDDDGVNSLINDDLSAITFQIRTHSSNAKNGFIVTEKELSDLVKLMDKELGEIAALDGQFDVQIWGETVLLSSISKYLIKDQRFSLIFTIIIVFFITLIMLRSIYFAFSALIPLSFGVIMNFTIMSIFGISLDVATVMIAAISIGIGIDDSIHFILHYKKSIEEGLSVREAVRHTIKYTSRPIIFTSLALVSGFLVFLFSSFRPIIYFGMLIAISVFNCTFATLFILPSYFLVTDKLRRFGRKKKSV